LIRQHWIKYQQCIYTGDRHIETVIRKWGNSPALRLSAAAMKLANFDLEQRVTIKAEKGRIVIEPCDKVEYKLEDLVAGMTAKNLQDEVSFEKPVGQEAL